MKRIAKVLLRLRRRVPPRDTREIQNKVLRGYKGSTDETTSERSLWQPSCTTAAFRRLCAERRSLLQTASKRLLRQPSCITAAGTSKR
ncbi:hypothetical protein C0J52_07811 [Blattella germanica]|nr:hypothetical protein C0J52_07811 [Blattella germanica]